MSEPFRVSNGTRQGSVISPALFSLYIDDLINELREMGLGCRIGGMWMAAVGYADVILLMAPNRIAMEGMLNICEIYADRYSLKFSTDENPNKSKSKCIYMTNKKCRNPEKPVPLKLYGRNLPWVNTATHLGNELCSDGTMNHDCNVKRAKFIDNSIQVRELLKFAEPNEMLRAIYSYDLYGSHLWDLYGSSAEQLYRCWNTTVKLCWDIPRSTHTGLLKGFLSRDHLSLRVMCISRYSNFTKSLISSKSKEVAVMSRLVMNDVSTVTGSNCINIRLEIGQTPYNSSSKYIRENILMKEYIPEEYIWSCWLLERYIEIRRRLRRNLDDTTYIDELIDSLCSS